MKAVILAAGRGSRMGAHTDPVPKCLIELAGRPLLEWQMTALQSAGIKRIAAVGGYRSETLEGRGLTLFRNSRWAETNMVASLACAAEWLRDGPCIISYADIFYEPAAPSLLMDLDAPLAITYDVNWLEQWSRRFADPLSDAETLRLDGDGNLTEIGRRPSSLSEIEGQYMGLLRLTPEGWRWIEEILSQIGPAAVDRLDMTSLLDRLIAAGRPIKAVPFAGIWGECDSPGDLDYHQARSGLTGVL